MKQQKQQRGTDAVFDRVMRHPFVFTALFCLLLLPLGFAQKENITVAGNVTEAVIMLLGFTVLIALGKPSSSQKVNVYLMISSAVIIVLFAVLVGENENNSTVMFVPAALILLQLGVVLYREKALNTDRVVVLLIVLGVIARYCYALKYNCTQMQHDVGTFKSTVGHEAYIMYWYKNGLALPDFDVTTRWQFYHPPLHHMLMALGLQIFTTLGLSMERAQEAIQILPVIYSALSMVVCFRVFKLVGLGGAGMVVAMSVVCFYPTFIIWGGAYNNDMLCTLFMLLAIMWTLKWYFKPTLLNILPIALCIGLGMMTKLSAWMVAPAVALVFLVLFIRNIKKPLPFIGQYAAFGAVCAPLGLWWGVRNLMTFGIPITYVPDVKMPSMSVESIPAGQRLFDFSVFQFDYPYMAFTNYHAPYNEYNPMMGLLKTSLFDEYSTPWDFTEMATVLLCLACLLAIVSFAGLLYTVFKKGVCADVPVKAFFVIIFFTILISYYLFCFQFPYVCTENIRYCIPVIPILAIGLGFGVNGLLSKKSK